MTTYESTQPETNLAFTHYALCIRNDGYRASLEVRKIYPAMPTSELPGFVRVVDNSGEDYLFPSDYFLMLQLPEEVERVLASLTETTTSTTGNGL